MNQNNGHEPKASEWPDGVTIKWKASPCCGEKSSFFDNVTLGEPVVAPQGTTKLFLFPMPYDTLLGQKQITAMVDICPKCGTMYCRGILKQTVIPEARMDIGRRN